MRHRIDKKFFNRDTKSRRSLLHGVALGVFEHGEIITTKAKGKEAQRLIDSCIVKAKSGDLAARRQLHRIFGRRDVVNNLCERVAPVFVERQSGFSRMTLIGNRRGDNTAMYRLSLVEVLPPTKKSEALMKAVEAKLTEENTKAEKKTKKTTTKVNSEKDKAAQKAIAHDQTIPEKVSKIKTTPENKVPRKNSVVGGGRGK